MTESSLYTEVARQVPAVGVGLFVFIAYQKLVGKLIEVMQASTAALTANTSALMALKESIERGQERAEGRYEQVMAAIQAVPGKVPHELANDAHARLARERLGRQ